MDHIKLLKDLVEINSGTRNKAGVDKVGALLAAKLETLGFKETVYKHDTRGDLRWFKYKTSSSNGPKILISGHIDTVFEPESGFLNYTEDEEYAYGPGTNDMKGGLVIMVMALEQLVSENFDLSNVGVILSPDEEMGSSGHEEQMAEIYKQYDYGLVLEGVGDNWELCDERKGVTHLYIQTSGKAGHAGHHSNKPEFPSAIHRLIELCNAVVALADREAGTTINVGFIQGGDKLNVIADTAKAGIDIRYNRNDHYTMIMDTIKNLVDSVPESKLNIVVSFPAMEKGPKHQIMLEKIKRAGENIGREIRFESRGSSSDGNQMSTKGVTVVDGFGVKGYELHSHNERAIKSSLEIQSRLLAAVLKELSC